MHRLIPEILDGIADGNPVQLTDFAEGSSDPATDDDVIAADLRELATDIRNGAV